MYINGSEDQSRLDVFVSAVNRLEFGGRCSASPVGKEIRWLSVEC